ncbi:E3 ubiquitin-protein ligase makorin-like isoform X1 [Lolium rigidum]|uniref:E3 ubiquitin-protein ligase makorin-like isoform X1 n=1 Tax=Lolium rigidum TaxID=89674 RepID=UPI001F5C404E|nr:E3 ubiquitin-protein ligase makorin-like isoform X1 [Lolium rigidum]
MSTARVLCSFSKHGACVEGESSELSHHSTGQANNFSQVCAFYQKGACSNDARFTHDHVGVSHSNPVFQHGGAEDVMWGNKRSVADPHQAVLH